MADHPDGLGAYLDGLTNIGVRAGIGIEVFNDIENEAPLDISKPVLEQRLHFSYNWHISRPSITSQAVELRGNGAMAPVFLDPNLLMLHLRFADHEQLEHRQNLRIEAFAQNRGGAKSRWRLNMIRTLKQVRNLWERAESSIELPHREFIKNSLPEYKTKPLEDGVYPKFSEHGMKEVNPRPFVNPGVTNDIGDFRYRFPDRCKNWHS